MLFFCFKGVCPQQNVLFDFLTVKEHLEFYSGLKEVENDEMDALVTFIIHSNVLHLTI